jgi:hypothetical protein
VRECLAYLLDMHDSQPPTLVFLTQGEVAELLRLPLRTVEDWRLTRSGPPWLKLGRHVPHEQGDVLAWVRGRRHE